MRASNRNARRLSREIETPKPRKRRATPGETSRDKLYRIGTYRVNNTIHQIRLLRPLAGENYGMKLEEGRRIIELLENEIRDLRDIFAGAKRKQEPLVKFD